MRPLAIAHRGYHQKYFENTKEAFQAASGMDFYGIETDIHLTKDLHWITHHNDDIISDGKHFLISELNLKEILAMHLDNDQGHDNATVCKFEDYLAICKQSGKRPIIEIKNSPKRKYLKSLLKYIDEFIGLHNVTIIGFYPWPLWKIKFMRKYKVHMQHLIEKHTEFVYTSILLGMDIDIEYVRLTDKMVKKMHRHGLKVNVWTIDDVEVLRKMEDMGVDYITTDVFDQKA